MTTPLDIRPGSIDVLALGALVHRLDPGAVPFRKAGSFAIHVSGGEFNCAANLADCFGMNSLPGRCPTVERLRRQPQWPWAW